jgi:hypothetical protein
MLVAVHSFERANLVFQRHEAKTNGTFWPKYFWCASIFVIRKLARSATCKRKRKKNRENYDSVIQIYSKVGPRHQDLQIYFRLHFSTIDAFNLIALPRPILPRVAVFTCMSLLRRAGSPKQTTVSPYIFSRT